LNAPFQKQFRPRDFLLAALLASTLLAAQEPYGQKFYPQKFYPDDPIQIVPPSRNVDKLATNKVGVFYDFLRNTFGRQALSLVRAQEVNTLGEVPDSAWYTNRHYRTPLTLDELVRGPGNETPPSTDQPWKIVAAKSEGVTPGFTIEDSQQRKYVLKFDPPSNPEIASAADVISSKFFYALGYNVPENYVVYFDHDQLQSAVDSNGRRVVSDLQIEEMLHRVPRDSKGRYRAAASLFLKGEILGPFLYSGTRGDDPNDVVPHENRRDLRGLYVFAAWLGHHDTKAGNSLDVIVEENGRRYVKHYLIDFGATLGSASYGAKSPRAGYEYLFSPGHATAQVLSLGLYVPRWASADYGDSEAVGRFEAQVFDPDAWKPNYPNPAFDNRLADDTFWAAKQVASFTNEQIRAIVRTGQYSDPRAEQYIVDCLIARRDKITRTFFAKVLPLDHFAIQNGVLTFQDLAQTFDLHARRDYSFQWYSFDNTTGQKQPLPDATPALPRRLLEGPGEAYAAAEIRTAGAPQSVLVYVRKRGETAGVVGVEHTWPGAPSVERPPAIQITRQEDAASAPGSMALR
jgi:hypothetical protein